MDHVNSLCDGVFSSTQRSNDFYMMSSVALMKLKRMNRETHLSIASQTKVLDGKKSILDKLQLQLENLRYKEAHLTREIRDLKNLPTPNLSEIERELEQTLGTLVYSDNMEEINVNTSNMLQSEMSSRISALKARSDIEAANKQVGDILDKKRKFLDDLPVKMDSIKKVALGVSSQFDDVTEVVTTPV